MTRGKKYRWDGTQTGSKSWDRSRSGSKSSFVSRAKSKSGAKSKSKSGFKSKNRSMFGLWYWSWSGLKDRICNKGPYLHSNGV